MLRSTTFGIFPIFSYWRNLQHNLSFTVRYLQNKTGKKLLRSISGNSSLDKLRDRQTILEVFEIAVLGPKGFRF